MILEIVTMDLSLALRKTACAELLLLLFGLVHSAMLIPVLNFGHLESSPLLHLSMRVKPSTAVSGLACTKPFPTTSDPFLLGLVMLSQFLARTGSAVMILNTLHLGSLLTLQLSS